MNAVARLTAHLARQFASALLAFALGLLWLALALLIVTQLFVATRHELSVPAFVLRRLEARLDEAGLRATFDRATFDPTGRILVESPRLFLPGFADPVVTSRAAYVGLSPWPALVGRIDARDVRLVDATLLVPAMLSPSGRADPIAQDIDALIIPGDREFVLRHVSGRLGGLIVSAHGSVRRVPGPRRSPEQLAGLIRERFTEFCRVAVEFSRRVEAFEQPSLDLELVPSPTHAAIVSADLTALGFKREAPLAVQLGSLRVTTHFPMLGAAATIRLDLTSNELHLPEGIDVRRVTASLFATVTRPKWSIEPREVEATAEQVTTPDGSAESVSLVAHPAELPRWRGELVGRLLESELFVKADLDPQARTAVVGFSGSVAPQVLKAVSGRVKVDVRRFFDFEQLDCRQATATFGPDWKFQRLAAQVALRGINAYGVKMNDGYATVELDPLRFYAPEAYGRIGPNFARGSYEHDFRTHEFRFLLAGRLRPLEIGAWFHPWWDHFFQRFAFPDEPPAASVDVHGFWREGERTSVFVFADAKHPVAMGQTLGRVRTRLFIRPGFYDGLELFGTDPTGGTVQGTFAIVSNVGSGEWRTLDFEGTSAIPFGVAASLGGELAKPLLSPFEVAGVPTVRVSGHLQGPDIAGVRHQQLDLAARSAGSFKFHHLPFEDVAFTVKMRDDELTVDATEARFAGGKVRAHVTVSGREPERRLGFDARVSDASLGVAVAAVQTFNARRNGRSAPPAGRFVQEKANVRVDVAASGEGRYGNLLSFHGGGNASLRGAEIGEVSLFGPLSELLKFTALRFTTAAATFKIDGTKLVFPEFAVRGANSAIDAHGEYALDRQQLDFRAKVFPFQESGSVIKSVVGAVLTPLSNVLEVKLTGTLEKPDWAFVIGPTNLLRSLSPDEPQTAGSTPAAGPAEADAKVTPAPPPAAPKAD